MATNQTLVPITETTATDCLLLVDANEAEANALAATLRKVGFEILPALTGRQGIKLLESRQPDLILLDLRLPDMDGFAVCRRVQENPEWADIPIVFLSADTDKNLVARALEGGAVDYIAKPFHKQELLSRVRTHLMLKTARDYARRLAQDKDEIVGMISHHLQNHLVGMHMSAQLLLERTGAGGDPALRMMAENIRSSSGQMRAFIRTFLANAAADHGLPLAPAAVDLSEAAMRALHQHEDAARAKELVLRADLPDEPLAVHADPSAVGQVVDNLLSNAVKFSPRGKEVMVAVRRVEDQIEFRIQDQGEGFTEADKARMFRRYARLSARPTGGEPSTGLGLSIVKRLVEAMGGLLICESSPGMGATFLVRLPRAAGRPAAGQPGPAPVPDSALNGLR